MSIYMLGFKLYNFSWDFIFYAFTLQMRYIVLQIAVLSTLSNHAVAWFTHPKQMLHIKISGCLYCFISFSGFHCQFSCLLYNLDANVRLPKFLIPSSCLFYTLHSNVWISEY